MIQILVSINVFLGTILLGGGVFYAEYLYPSQIADAKDELKKLVDSLSTLEIQQAQAANQFILFDARTGGYERAFKQEGSFVDAKDIPAPSADFRVEAFQREDGKLVLRGFTSPGAVRAGRRPVLLYSVALDPNGIIEDGKIEPAPDVRWVPLSNGTARLSSLTSYLQ